ncbi:ABC-three component system protein [Streptomyces sp. NPDC057579]|uniref:ABC-three component system protein n=1 Tax=Streptomyces sp. NPDC057579 TaxID=3346172 RepID=UPI003690F7F3
MADTTAPFEAAASAVGYVYQLRKALHSCVDQHGRGLDWCIAIEAGDDVEEVIDGGRVLYQLKHRAAGVTMSDYSTDLWKTLRIWAHGITNKQLELDETDLFLLTTADLTADSAGYHLQPVASGVRDESRALKALEAARKASTSKGNKKAYEAFDKLSADQRRDMLARIQVIGNAPDVDEVENLLLERVVSAVGHAYAKPFLQRLEGWFYQRTIRQLRTDDMDAVTGDEFDQIFTDLRNQFRPENLPIDEDIAVLEPDPSDYANMTFVRQLDLIDISKTRVGIAVRDYIRAFTQRSRWSDDNLLLPGEISKYERRLIEEWRDLFAEMEDDLGAAATEAEKLAAAKEIYRWATREARPRIRIGCDEPFVSKGSFHILANDLQVGWHIDFMTRLMAVLEPAGATQA